MSLETRAELSGILGNSNPLNTGRYLGLPSLIERDKKVIFRYIRDRSWDNLKGWRNKKVYKAGKEVLIKSAVQAVLAFCSR